MTTADKFMKNLDQSLGNYPNKQEILMEYQLHVSEIIAEEDDANHQDQYLKIEQRLGTPAEIAKLWQEEIVITPRKTQLIFIIFNSCLFVGGGLLTIGYNLLDWSLIEITWSYLTSIPAIIIMIYLVFWALLGYEIGKEFGPRGRKMLKRTFLVCIAPNVLLMNLTVFGIIPMEWFQPLLNIKFILICIGFTALLYPISVLGYRWGKKASV
ncbi:hypothetical protein [Aquibacillus salsiterrae]|uniref:DUF1129 family protein n=1 Tax=Aquibacillus salsiterrae TaxID=2950439 RepID=A0A9X3WGX2_9BACI|nr:hypothetical protein [Aquibacillus salsiterrae]MDC3417239.1 hypothetical protein [Aquibacillus salsiterrae]